jgi:TonB family protein
MKQYLKYLLAISIMLSGLKAFTQTDSSSKAAEEEETFVNIMPQFPGGDNAMMEFIISKLKYPPYAIENDIQGKVVVSFIVAADGYLDSIYVLKGIDPSLDSAAINLIRLMPRWTPGSQNGKLVRVKYNLPLTFRLSPDTPAKSKRRNRNKGN